MMENQVQSTVDEMVETTCLMCLTIPISALALEPGIEVPLGGWSDLFDKMGIAIVIDPAGRRAIATLAARRLLATLKRQDELFVEDAQRRTERLAARHPVPSSGGLPVLEGASPFESMAAAAGGLVSPSQEFGSGRERPRFLQDELESSARDQAEKKREAEARAKQRLADQARKKLA